MNFDIADSRVFLRNVGLPEDLVLEFAALWDRTFRLDYRTVRARLKALALETYGEVRGAILLPHDEWDSGAFNTPSYVAFVDDDDWMSPSTFECFPPPSGRVHGVRWGSLRFGRKFRENGFRGPIIQKRVTDRVIYTNNYAVTSHAIRRFGLSAVFEHTSAQNTFDNPDFGLLTSDMYLSCAVKHPCCTVSALYLMGLDSFRSDPDREMRQFIEALDVVSEESLSDWLRTPFRRFRKIMHETLG